MRKIYTVCMAAVTLFTAGCSGDLKETLGLNHHGPDEYEVLSRPALTVPPEFSLRPPADGPEFVPPASATDQAHATVIGTSASTVSSPTPATPASSPASGFRTLAPTAVGSVTATSLPDNADAQFLSNAGADKADASVRTKISQDIQNGVTPNGKDNTYLINPKSTEDPVVDATKEAGRIKQDQQAGQPVTGATTPVVTPPDKGILSTIGSWF